MVSLVETSGRKWLAVEEDFMLLKVAPPAVDRLKACI
jgi:hypothetical protein